ncbi:glycosyltransferase [candidate division WS5 bacterium]|uniref:Glycosyltransferase n=1 Tax=candidate division WS5 bacterium TaxID=2093353 RepID=A0A419DFV1_9BACT|nr:MAG: glycosyltransferase [candidate division WS5 bacterium]
MSKKPKVCLNLEFFRFMGGIFYKDIGTGLLSSYKNQKVILKRMGVEYTENTKDKEYNILHVNLFGPMSLYLVKRDKRKGRKVIGYAHNSPEDMKDVFRFSNIIAPFFKRWLVYMENQCDIVICPSEYTRKNMANHGVKTPLVAMSNAVDTKKYSFSAEKRAEGRKSYELNKLTVFSVGLVLPRKSPSTLIKMAKKFQDTDFIWFGKIYSGAMVKKLPKSLPKNLRFTGFVDDIITAYCSGDIFVFPSHEENEGMVILEAASMGKPLVVRDIPVYEGWLVHGESCFKAKNQEEFEKYVRMLLKDDNLRKKMGEKALELAQRNSVENIGKKYMKIYSDLLGN